MMTRLERCNRLLQTKILPGFALRFFHEQKPDFESKHEEIKVHLPWGDLSGKWWGSTDVQPILCIHGWQDNAGSFDGLAPHLNMSVLAIDLPGHGFSSPIPKGAAYNFIDGVILIRHLARHFKWEDITIIGHSYGSALGFAYSAFFPKNVKNFISIECGRGALVQKMDNAAERLRKTIDSTLYFEEKLSTEPPAYEYDELIHKMHTKSRGPLSKESCEILSRRGANKSAEGKYRFTRDPRLKELFLGRLTQDVQLACSSRITCNVLSIVATSGWDLPIPEESNNLIKKNARRYEEHIVEGSHHLHLENPERVAPLILKFLNE